MFTYTQNEIVVNNRQLWQVIEDAMQVALDKVEPPRSLEEVYCVLTEHAEWWKVTKKGEKIPTFPPHCVVRCVAFYLKHPEEYDRFRDILPNTSRRMP